MRNTLLSLIASLLFSSQGSVAFTLPAQKPILRTGASIVSRSRALQASRRDEEIAKLEEQLRQLKQEQQQESETLDNVSSNTQQEISQVKQRILEKVQGKDMILSEQDLYDGNIIKEDQPTNGNIVQNILVAVGIVVFLGVFSQIPIGNENLSKYSATAGPTTSRTIDLGDLNTDSPRP